MSIKKVLAGVAILATGLIIASQSYAGNGRGAMDGTGPLSITSGCQGPFGQAAPGTGQQIRNRGQRWGVNAVGQPGGRR
ncbi:MAG: hypothetical protein ACP5TY_07890 [Thermodesulforhabdaceae bacterium]